MNKKKCNINIYIYVYIIYVVSKLKQYNFSHKFKRQVSKNVHLLIKFIYNILSIIKKYAKFGKYSFNFKQTFSNLFCSTLKSKTPKNATKKLIKLKNIIGPIRK